MSISLDERGNQLRLDFQKFYSDMRRNKTLRPGSNDIGEFIRRYIPEGITFDDAEHILRSAGIGVCERGLNSENPDWANQPDKDDVIAATLLPGRSMSRAELLLGLRPKAAGDYSTVTEVWAVIILSFS